MIAVMILVVLLWLQYFVVYVIWYYDNLESLYWIAVKWSSRIGISIANPSVLGQLVRRFSQNDGFKITEIASVDLEGVLQPSENLLEPICLPTISIKRHVYQTHFELLSRHHTIGSIHLLQLFKNLAISYNITRHPLNFLPSNL